MIHQACCEPYQRICTTYLKQTAYVLDRRLFDGDMSLPTGYHGRAETFKGGVEVSKLLRQMPASSASRREQGMSPNNLSPRIGVLSFSYSLMVTTMRKTRR